MKISKRKTKIIGLKSFILGLFFLLILVISCETTEPPPSNQKLTLLVEDASCTETWLNLKIENISLPTEIVLKQNDTTIITTNINSKDTTLFIENLLPIRTYSFKVFSIQQHVSSNNALVTTMDTTSHNFTWETFTFGGVNGSSVLNDIVIINENNIWAVGEIHTEDTNLFDSNGVWVKPYNAVHWDGVSWELKRILVDYRGEPNFAPLVGVFALPDEKIIFSSGLPYLPKGNSWQLYHLWDLGVLDNDDGGVNSIWGTSIDNLYFVGSKGTIVHYNGSTWTKIESQTETDILDIYGATNNLGEEKIFASVSKRSGEGEKKILLIDKEYKVSSISWEPQTKIYSIWTPSGSIIYTAGGGIYNNKDPKGWSTFFMQLPSVLSRKIRGNALNDISVCGDYGLIGHFNGINWNSYSELNLIDHQLFSIDVSSTLICIVGSNGRNATIVVGKK